MEMHFNELLDQITKFIESEATTETVIGKSFTLGEFECVPVIRIGMGFGSGGGGGNAPKNAQGEGGGAGAGMGIEPIGFLVTRNEEISFIGVNKSSKGISAAFEKVPDLVEKIMANRQKETA